MKQFTFPVSILEYNYISDVIIEITTVSFKINHSLLYIILNVCTTEGSNCWSRAELGKLWPSNKTQPTTGFINKVLLEHTLILFHIACGCFDQR